MRVTHGFALQAAADEVIDILDDLGGILNRGSIVLLHLARVRARGSFAGLGVAALPHGRAESAHDLHDERWQGGSLERVTRRRNLVQHAAQRPHVDGLGVRQALAELRREIVRRADNGLGHLVLLHVFGQPKVAQLDVEQPRLRVALEEHVLRLEVAVEDAGRLDAVHGPHGQRELGEEAHDRAERHLGAGLLALLHQVAQGARVSELHDNAELVEVLVQERVVVRDYVGVVAELGELLHDQDLALRLLLLLLGHLADVHLLDDKVAAVVLARDLEGRAERAAAEHIPALVLVHARGGGLRLPPSGSSRAHQRWHRDNPVTVQRQNAAACDSVAWRSAQLDLLRGKWHGTRTQEAILPD